MRKVVVCTNVSLDGVMQSPARADEDTRYGFRHGGWGIGYEAMRYAGDVFASTDALLAGALTWTSTTFGPGGRIVRSRPG